MRILATTKQPDILLTIHNMSYLQLSILISKDAKSFLFQKSFLLSIVEILIAGLA